MKSKIAFLLVISVLGVVISTPSDAFVSDVATGLFKAPRGAYASGLEKMPVMAHWTLPVKDSIPITSCYGPRHLLYKFYDFHEGVDFGAHLRTPVKAVAPGKVIWTGFMGCAGRGLIVEHRLENGENVLSLYKHLRSYLVHRGQQVQAGQKIALSGASGTKLNVAQSSRKRGCVVGPHLHIEFKIVNSELTLEHLEKEIRKTRGHLSGLAISADPGQFIPEVGQACSIASSSPVLIPHPVRTAGI